jgi:hypothetical protein
VIEDTLRAGLPGAPDWVFDIPLDEPTLGALWNHRAADISVMLEALRPYFGIVLEGALTAFGRWLSGACRARCCWERWRASCRCCRSARRWCGFPPRCGG